MKLRNAFGYVLATCTLTALGGGLSFGQQSHQDMTQPVWKSQASLYKVSLSGGSSSITVARYASGTRKFESSQTFQSCRGIAGRPNALECKVAYAVKTAGSSMVSSYQCQQMAHSNTGWCDPNTFATVPARTTTETRTIYKSFVIESNKGRLNFWIQNRDNNSYSMVECVPE